MASLPKSACARVRHLSQCPAFVVIAGLRVTRKVLRLLFFCSCLCFSSLAFAEGVTIVSGENRLPAEYVAPMRPDMPAVVLMHGCGGLYGKSGEMSSRVLRMGNLLREMGYAVLFLDSFTSRGIKQVCTSRSAARSLTPAMRANDAEAAIKWLRRQKNIDPLRIGLVGWSHGADAVLELMGRSNKAVRAAVTYYPACHALLGHKKYQISAPTLVLIGEEDRTPAADCRALSDQTGQDLFFVVSYHDALHDFDRPVQSPYNLFDVPNRARTDDGNDLAGPHPDAAQDAMRRTFKWFSRWFDPERALKGTPPVNKPRN